MTDNAMKYLLRRSLEAIDDAEREVARFPIWSKKQQIRQLETQLALTKLKSNLRKAIYQIAVDYED